MLARERGRVYIVYSFILNRLYVSLSLSYTQKHAYRRNVSFIAESSSMEETRKRQAEEDRTGNESSPRKCRCVSPSEKESESSGEVGEDIMAWLSIDDETASELLKLLDADLETSGAAGTTRVRFIDNPYSRSLIYQSSTSYVTINGNEESCGSSFSYSDSSMMVNVDARGINLSRHLLSGEGKAVGIGSQVEDIGGEWEWNEEEARGWEAVEIDWDDDVLARFLGE